MDSANDDDVRLVVSVAGLLACVAYSDRQYTPSERQKVRSELERIHGLSNEGIEGICKILDERIFDLTATSSQIYLRDLSELADYETKIDVLDVLMSLAAADESVSVVETNLLRRAATALGLSSDDYNTIQRRYRDKLAVLQKG
ncbi:MAG: TerB family tellurite resistance protein [Deltaproteobacteria bacterium]|nr:TerB family tellurite resistance protein [Deltaproteobacteria bacterium]